MINLNQKNIIIGALCLAAFYIYWQQKKRVAQPRVDSNGIPLTSTGDYAIDP